MMCEIRVEDVIRVVKAKLDVSTERCDELNQTKDQFLHCANTTAETPERLLRDLETGSRELRNETELTANLV